MPVYVRGTALKNRLDALFKLIMGKIYDTNAPGYRRNDKQALLSLHCDSDTLSSMDNGASSAH